jgi:twitching motility protein PilT
MIRSLASQLEQLLGYLERDGVTEVVVAAGKTITMRTSRGMTNLTARPLSAEQLASMIRGSEVAGLVPARDGETSPQEVQVGRRRALAQVTRRGDLLTISLTRSHRTGEPLATQPMARVATPETTRGRTPSVAPRTKGTTHAPRTKAATHPPRTKAATNAPRSKPSTRSPRTKAPSSAPGLRIRAGQPAPAPTASAFDSYPLDEDGIELGGIVPSPAPRPLVEPQVSSFNAIDLDQSLAAFDGALERVTPRPPTATPQPRPQMPSLELDIDLATNQPTTPIKHPLGRTPAPPLEVDIDLSTSRPAPPVKAPPSRSELGISFAKPAPAPAPTSADIDALSTPSAFGFSLELDEELAPPPPAEAAVVRPQDHSRVPERSRQPERNRPRGASRAFTALLETARARGASDLHVSAGRVTMMRIGPELVPLDPDVSALSRSAADDLLRPLLDDAQLARLDEVGYVDLALDAPGGGRLRTNVSRQQQGLKGTFRLAIAAPASLEELGLPADLAKAAHHHQGLIVIAGPSGHGKTTTLAALVDQINSTKAHHILTIEDPVEIIHPRKRAVISQREVGRDTMSFARGLKASLREDPDVIVIGELRDRESVEIALTAAETGHLVIATMSTPSAAKTIDRLVDMFPPEEHNQVRASVAGALRAIIAQRLVPRRGGGIVPAVELVTGVLPLAVMIREDKLYQLPNLMQRGRAFGMIRFDESLLEHVRAGRIDEDTALAFADSKKDLAPLLRSSQSAAQARPVPQPAAPPQPATSRLWGFGKKDGGR